VKNGSIIGLLLFAAILLRAQSFEKSKMDSLLLNISRSEKGMGSISIFEHENEIYQFTLGYADLKSRIKPTLNTKYRIGSVTKMFTATIIMQLIAEGKLSLQTTLFTYFPEIPHARQITIEQLLKHRSGLTDKKFQVWQQDGRDFKLAKKSEYANVNYGLLSKIAEQTVKTRFEDLLIARVFKPCHLKNTFYGNLPDSISGEAKSYFYDSGWKQVAPSDLSFSAGAGAIISTPTDINAFLFHLFSGKLVPPNSLLQMEQIIDGYGSGMMKIHFGDRIAFSHAGQIDGFQSRAMFFTAENLSITCCFNGVTMPLDQILIAVLSIYFKK
jgi:CubicO group peptidase (beta-lactamase class C family)